MTDKPFLYVVVCAAGVAVDVGELISSAQDRQWDVGVIATPQGLAFLDAAAVEARTGYPIRSAWRAPGDPRPLPDPDAIAVAPATFNTINKWAGGIADTLAVATLCEAYGAGVPTGVLPCVNEKLAVHPAYRASLERLRGMGVAVADATRRDGERGFPWERVLDLPPLRAVQTAGQAPSAPSG